MALDKFVLRTVVGGLMVGHGLQKLNGSFGGPGLEGTEKTMRALGMYPPELQARAVALSETIGGGLTALGLFSPLGPAMIMGTMAVAVQKVHLKNGLWASRKGYEFNLTLIAASFALAADGPGLLSVDWLLGKQRSGLRWALAAAALGGGAAAAALKMGEKLVPVGSSSGVAGDGPTEEPRSAPSARFGRQDRPAPDRPAPDRPAPDRPASGLSETGHPEHAGRAEHQGPEHHGSEAGGSEAGGSEAGGSEAGRSEAGGSPSYS